MFSFHKPKVYRSSTGCCICKAKSSSSRFTDSKKYELDFIECFQLTTPRRGEICNACVLLVKRFKRLPPGSDRHWGHVVDARVGPGLKSMSKFKKRKEEQKDSIVSSKKSSSSEKTGLASVPERFCKIFKKNKSKKVVKKEEHSGSSDESSPNSPASSTTDADSNDNLYAEVVTRKYRRKNYFPAKNKRGPDEVLDLQYWKKRKTCCGYVYENEMCKAVMIDLTLYKPCKDHAPKTETEAVLEKELSCGSMEDLLIKLTDEQIQENYENASMSGFKKISKAAENHNNGISNGMSNSLAVASIIPTTTALKKHHLYSKRAALTITSTPPMTISSSSSVNSAESVNGNSSYVAAASTGAATLQKTDNFPKMQYLKSAQDATVITTMSSPSPFINPPVVPASRSDFHSAKMNGNSSKDPLHKIKADNGGKVIKNSLAALKLKPLEFKVKDLVKICTEKALKSKLLGNQEGVIGDNSSDSGYEEAHEQQVRYSKDTHIL